MNSVTKEPLVSLRIQRPGQTEESAWTINLVLVSSPQDDKRVQVVIPRPDQIGAAAICGTAAEYYDNRDVVLLEPQDDGSFSERHLFEDISLTSIIFRPGHDMIVCLKRNGMDCYSLRADGEQLGSIETPAILAADFNRQGGVIMARTQRQLCGFWVQDDGPNVKISLNCALGRYGEGTASAVSFSPAKHVCFISGDKCLRLNGSIFPPHLETLPDLPENQAPLAVACSPSADGRTAKAVFVGWGPFAHAIDMEGRTWSSRRIAPNSELIGAQGVAFVNADACVGWRSNELFVFRIPTRCPMQPPNHDAPRYITSWNAPPDLKILSAQVVAGTREILVYATSR